MLLTWGLKCMIKTLGTWICTADGAATRRPMIQLSLQKTPAFIKHTIVGLDGPHKQLSLLQVCPKWAVPFLPLWSLAGAEISLVRHCCAAQQPTGQAGKCHCYRSILILYSHQVYHGLSISISTEVQAFHLSQSYFLPILHVSACNLHSLIMYKDGLGQKDCFLTGPTQVLCPHLKSCLDISKVLNLNLWAKSICIWRAHNSLVQSMYIINSV